MEAICKAVAKRMGGEALEGYSKVPYSEYFSSFGTFSWGSAEAAVNASLAAKKHEEKQQQVAEPLPSVHELAKRNEDKMRERQTKTEEQMDKLADWAKGKTRLPDSVTKEMMDTKMKGLGLGAKVGAPPVAAHVLLGSCSGGKALGGSMVCSVNG